MSPTIAPALTNVMVASVPPDSECEPFEDTAKFCNGDYAGEDWASLTRFVTKDNVILASTSLMNDAVLRKRPDDQKRYVLCHEMEHEFGLLDEDDNRNHCMDSDWSKDHDPRP